MVYEGEQLVMERQGDSQVRLITVDLETFVPANHLLRQVKRKVDFTFIYEKVRHLYKPGGRPAEPVVLVKMWLIGYMYGIPSERRLEQEVNMNLAYRWFLGIPLDERVPDHSTLSNNRNGRFKDGTLVLDVFEGIVAQCKQAGLIQGTAVVTDSTHVEANVNDDAYETVTVTKAPSEYFKALEATAQALNAAADQKRNGKKRGPKGGGSVAKPQEREEIRSTTDPDAGILGRPGKPSGFHYLAHVTVEPSHGIIVDAKATAANISDHEPYVECIRRTKQRIELTEAAADGGYDVISVHKPLADLEVTTYIPAVEHRSGAKGGNRFTVRDFTYQPETDSYQCPGAKTLCFSSVKEFDKIYRAKQPDCQACPLAARCLPPTAKYRLLKRPIHQEYLEVAHARNGTVRYADLMRERRIWSEATFAILKARHGLKRAVRRGLHKMQEQLLMASVALNLYRLAAATQ